MHETFEIEKLNERDHLEDVIIKGKTKFKWMLKKWCDVVHWSNSVQNKV
jgi:hypothetical protein